MTSCSEPSEITQLKHAAMLAQNAGFKLSIFLAKCTGAEQTKLSFNYGFESEAFSILENCFTVVNRISNMINTQNFVSQPKDRFHFQLANEKPVTGSSTSSHTRQKTLHRRRWKTSCTQKRVNRVAASGSVDGEDISVKQEPNNIQVEICDSIASAEKHSNISEDLNQEAEQHYTTGKSLAAVPKPSSSENLQGSVSTYLLPDTAAISATNTLTTCPMPLLLNTDDDLQPLYCVAQRDAGSTPEGSYRPPANDPDDSVTDISILQTKQRVAQEHQSSELQNEYSQNVIPLQSTTPGAAFCPDLPTSKSDYRKVRKKASIVKVLHKCPDCNFKSPFLYRLKQHSRTHTGERPYKCEQCDYTAALLSTLRVHQKTHTGERPYKCHLCDYAASQNSTLRVHQKLHSGERPYKCPHCDYTGALRKCLTLHLRTHTGERPYKCQYCNYSAARLNTLKSHEKTHNVAAERPYHCLHCDHKCARADLLKEHMRTHTGEKPFKCQKCDYAAASVKTLKFHAKTRHNEKPNQLPLE